MCIAVTRSYLVWFGIQIAQAMLAGWEKLRQKKNFFNSTSSKGFIHFLRCALGISWGKGLYNKPCFPIFQNFGLVLCLSVVCFVSAGLSRNMAGIDWDVRTFVTTQLNRNYFLWFYFGPNNYRVVLNENRLEFGVFSTNSYRYSFKLNFLNTIYS